MKIYNSLVNKLEEFIPIKNDEVSMYVCGPTVYSDPHIGNARPLIVFDLVYRFLTALNYKVKYVSNYTDIDDKIIDKALKENKSATYIGDKYIKVYEDLALSLNIKSPQTIRVSETINQIIDFIKEMIELDYAYQIEGDVYFRVNKVNDYGQLSKQKIDDLLVGARVDENTKKENPLDFTLWKETTVGENYKSPWSMGRPGWHTECVVMIRDAFKANTIDIHGGGLDLKFPHHENEIAQANACCESDLAKYWMHNGLVSINNQKMSKSQGELILAKDMVKDLGADIVRWLILSTHYRAPLQLSDDLISQSQSELHRIYLALNQAGSKLGLEEVVWTKELSKSDLDLFYNALKDDFSTPNAYKVIFDSIKALNSLLREKELDYLKINQLSNSIISMLDILGINYQKIEVLASDKELYAKWNLAKDNKDYSQADIYRKQLIKRGLI